MSDSYKFTRLSEVPQAEELNEGDEILVVQEGSIKRSNKLPGGGSAGYRIIITEEAISMSASSGLIMLDYTLYEEVSKHLKDNALITFEIPMSATFGAMDSESIPMPNVITYPIMIADITDEQAQVMSLPSGGIIATNSYTEFQIYIPNKQVDINTEN